MFLTVDLLINESRHLIKPGMTANVDIMIQHVDNVLTVPLVAVMDDGDVPLTWLLLVTRRAIHR